MITPDERDWRSPSTSAFALAAAQRAKLVVGKRIQVTRASSTLSGRHGVIVTVGGSGQGDCAVLLDEWEHTLAFYWCELEVAS